MNRLIALLLSSLFLMGGCGGAPAQQAVTGQQAQLLKTHVLAAAEEPELPVQPDDGELEKELTALSGKQLTDQEYEAEYSKLMDRYGAQADAYRAAVSKLRGTGTGDLSMLTPYTVSSIGKIMGDTKGKNCVYSPANLYLALAMLSETTDGASRQQILNLLGVSDITALRTQADAVWRNLYVKSGSGETNPANSIWLDQDMTYRQKTLDTLAEQYHASAYRVDTGTEEANKTLGAWLDSNTGGLLSKEASAVTTQPETLLAIASTLYFRDQWADKFDVSATSNAAFADADGTSCTAPFLHQTLRGKYEKGSGYTAAELPFMGGASMRLVLPDAGVTPEQLLSNPETMKTLIESVEQTGSEGELVWSIPKFDVTSTLQLPDALKALGITDVFDSAKADFTPLTDTPAVLDSVQHSARVKVDEEGCEAAAFTVMMDTGTAMPKPVPQIEMNLNRPFLFLITGVDGLPLFVGVVNTLK